MPKRHCFDNGLCGGPSKAVDEPLSSSSGANPVKWQAFSGPAASGRVPEFAPSTYPRSRADLHYRTADLVLVGVDDVVDIADMPMYAESSFDLLDRIASRRVKVLQRR
jgi:hypothetical protein